ncbi:MAG: hypothetical protein LKM30_02275 [Bacilli bacterium]|jgi:hypothetical protein|nr:hypothetical protein [Bacilli bacterium]
MNDENVEAETTDDAGDVYDLYELFKTLVVLYQDSQLQEDLAKLPKEKQAALFQDLEALALKEGMDPDPNLLEGIPEQFNAKIFYPFHDIDKLSDFSQGEAKLAKSYGVLLHHTVMCQDMRDDVHVRVTDADPKLLTDTTDDGSANGQNKRG